ncbi:MAG: SRPBCC family protein [Planctomycetota bacterium]|jgi:carbon monoxide dehydrogenase subunit G
MTRTIVTRQINAPVDKVFDTVAHIDNFRKAVPAIVNVEVLSDVKQGVGTRFRETRLMKGKEGTVELEVTEYVENDHVRIVSDTHGTVWDTVFKVTPQGDQTELVMTMDANAHKLLPKLVNPLIKGMIQKYIEKDMDAVKRFCEAPPA